MIHSIDNIRIHRIIFVCILASISLFAFSPNKPQEFAGRQMVKLNILVTDRNGHLVTDLRQEDFRVWEDGQPQKIESFFYGETPVSYALLIDTSGSMRRLIPYVVSASNTIITANKPDDQTLLATFRGTGKVEMASRLDQRQRASYADNTIFSSRRRNIFARCLERRYRSAWTETRTRKTGR